MIVAPTDGVWRLCYLRKLTLTGQTRLKIGIFSKFDWGMDDLKFKDLSGVL